MSINKDDYASNIIECKQSKTSAFELLRIIAMILIIMHHYAYEIYTDYTSPLSGNLFFLQFFYMFGKLGVNLFVFITGFFLCDKEFKLNKLIRLELLVIFYSVFFNLIFVFLFHYNLEKSILFESFFPLISSKYWFYNTYFVLYLLFPYLNIFLNCDKKCLLKLIFILLLIWSILPAFPKIHPLEKSNLGWFVLLYFSGAYIKKYNSDFNHKPVLYISIAFILICILLFQVFLFDLLGTKNIIFRKKFDYYQSMNSVFMFSIAALLFISFSKMKFHNNFINIIGGTTFGVYLIHGHNFVADFLWGGIFNFRHKMDEPSLIPFSFMAVLVVFAGCSIIELLRLFINQKIVGLYNRIKKCSL